MRPPVESLACVRYWIKTLRGSLMLSILFLHTCLYNVDDTAVSSSITIAIEWWNKQGCCTHRQLSSWHVACEACFSPHCTAQGTSSQSVTTSSPLYHFIGCAQYVERLWAASSVNCSLLQVEWVSPNSSCNLGYQNVSQTTAGIDFSPRTVHYF